MARRRTVDEHAARIAALVGPSLNQRDAEIVPLAAALGRVLVEPVVTAGPLPPFRNAQMDGYAARHADVRRTPVVLPVDGVQPAGPAVRTTLEAGHLLKVMTGAPVPEGADCVVPVEQTAEEEGGVRVLRTVEPGAFVREAGSDALPGTVVVPAFTHLAPRHLAAAAAAGVAEVAVRRRPRVAVIATGAEVVPPGAPLELGQVHDVNGIALSALAAEAGAEIVLVDLTPDDPAAFERCLERAVAESDLVLTAGGVSKGDFEVVRQVLEPLGADVTEIAMQPGGPQGFASVRGVPVVCLPGNPVSAQVSFTVFLRPLLRAAVGLPPVAPQVLPLAAALHSPKGKRQWLRGVVKHGSVYPVGGPGSHLVVAMAGADALIDVPAETDFVAAGSSVSVLPL
ncbi:molybdopterin molybdotransferase MoeA [Amnibacterium setariae]|uniref:Molybdopterin molybdenumtransferase n=1 Tax=Amnibacterium setariae TaxID=2306585 RepID=A0A3A1U2I6_9MICO|nr:gephyrin-like molybdotransferase Glp [Amnibacterium setariae]RIX28676.1 molybdopterin molybdenumtransferase MoeA [Amnibacterium setariae]